MVIIICIIVQQTTARVILAPPSSMYINIIVKHNQCIVIMCFIINKYEVYT